MLHPEALRILAKTDNVGRVPPAHFITYCEACHCHHFTNRIVPPPCRECGKVLIGWRVK